MATIPVSASPVSTFTATVDLTVERPRIQKISISGFRAFPPYRPKSFEVDLGNDGKNLLLYGENGSGKTSLFRALRDLCDTSDKQRTYAKHQNVFMHAEDDAIMVELTSGTPSEYRWEIGEPHPKENGGEPFQTFARSCVFLDYRDLLEISFVHRTGNPNLFKLLVGAILADLPFPDRKLSEIYHKLLESKPERLTKRSVTWAVYHSEKFSETLRNQLPEVVTEGNRLLAKLQKGTRFSLDPAAMSFSKEFRNFTGENIALSVTYNGTVVAEPQHFLNEARLTAIAISIYLAGARIIRVGRPGIIILDDVLIGLDLSNRIPLLNLLREEFGNWQILLLTHDHTWYELAKEYTEYAGGWTCKEMYLVDSHEGEAPIPEIKDGLSPLDRATAHLVANDLTAAAVYLRAAFEARLRNVCDDNGIEIPFKKQIKEVKANDLWNGILARQAKRRELQTNQPIKNHPDFISSALVQKVEMMRSTILNRLSHTDSPNFAKSEVQTARDIIEELQSHPFPKRNP
jgi:energy-coupling factor transporter ATP-binding protein EcfA2